MIKGLHSSSISICPTNIIFDEPVTGDEFGPHQRIADAIAALINESDKSVAVGIEGAWGSGKTTIVNLLRNALSHQDYALITFDAWAHEGDPLRRTFLENVIDQLEEKQKGTTEDSRWINPEVWKIRLDEIAKRRTVEESKNVPKLGKWDKVLILSIAFVPLGNALFSSALREHVTIRWGAPAWKFLWEGLLGLLFLLAPIVVLLWRRYWKRENWDNLNIWTLLSSKGVSESRTESYKTPEPTTIEFEKRFRELTEEALKHPKRKIILVIDNLDRVDSKDALTLWSTLQTFLQYKPGNKYHWLNRLWIVVLYDPRGLSALWSGASDGAGGVAAASVYKSFVDKTFQVRFEVPAPVLSEWRDFLMQKLQKAFPDHTEDWHTVYRVRALHSGKRRPTARELKLFVNQIGSLHRQWARGGMREQDEYPLSHIACYVILREAFDDLLPYLLNGALPNEDDKNLLGPDIGRSLAGLLFNIERERAYQMLLDAPIKSALIYGKESEIKVWAEKNDGFWEVLESVVSSQWFGDAPNLLANAAKVLEESGVLSTTDRPEVKTVVRSLCESATRQTLLPYDGTDRAQGLVILCRWNIQYLNAIKPEKFMQSILRSMTNWLLQESHTREIDTESWLKITHQIANEMSSTDAASLFTEGIITPIVELYKTPAQLMAYQIIYSLEILLELANQTAPLPTAVEQLHNLAASSHFHDYLKSSTNVGERTKAMCLFAILVYQEGGIKGMNDDQLAARPDLKNILLNPPVDFVGRFTDLLYQKKRLNLLIDILDNLQFAINFVIGCLRYIVKDKIEYAETLFTPETLTLKYSDIWYRIDTEPEDGLRHKLISYLVDKTPLIKHISNSIFDVALVRLYGDVYEVSRDEDFKTWCYQGLKQIKREKWEQSLRGQTGLFNFIYQLDAPSKGNELSEDYSQALLACAKEIIAGRFNPAYPNLWQSLPRALADAERKQLRRALLTILVFADGAVSEQFITIFEEEISDADLLNSQSEIFSSVFIPLVKNKNFTAIKWLAKILPYLDANKVVRREQKAVQTLRGEIDSLKEGVIIKEEEREAVTELQVAWKKFLDEMDPSSGILIQ